MSETEQADSLVGAVIAARYRIEALIGRGGMGHVYRAVDVGKNHTVALKRLHEVVRCEAEMCALFEREYQTLAGLSHPCIIKAYDYGLEGDCPYYTMELLTGRELRALVPMPWQRACVVLRDVASALALLHSRRQVHRDISARNVHVLPDGRARLIDFGALTPMGSQASIVGTPPHVAPEVFYLQPIDGRADLYALGALAYLILTGRHAYPARKLPELLDLWRAKPRDPAELRPDLPAALCRLVLSLLSLDRLARPSSAAEVIDRLAAIAGLPSEDSPAISTSYLIMPTLVGREAQTLHFRKKVLQAVRQRGAALMIAAGSGRGRSRLLTSFWLEARLLGVTVLHADATKEGDYATARALVKSAFEVLPAPAEAALTSPIAELFGRASPETEPPPQSNGTLPSRTGEPRAPIHEALVHFFVELSKARCLLVSVDDLERCDVHSLAMLLALARELRENRLLLVTTADERSLKEFSALRLLANASFRISLAPFSPVQTRELLGSVFGEVPHLKLTADWIHGVASGSPAISMQLAQHLVDRGLARYEGGSWTLPQDPKLLSLPGGVAEAFAAKIDALSCEARTLANALALCVHGYALRTADWARFLYDTPSSSSVRARLAVHRVLDELVAADLIAIENDAPFLRQRAWGDALRARLEPRERAALERRLVEAYGGSNCREPLVLAHHLFEAGDAEAALDTVMACLPASAEASEAGWRNHALEAACFERALATARRLGRSRAVTSPLLVILTSLAHHHDTALLRYADEAIAQLRIDIGLDHLKQLDHLTDPFERIKCCLALAARAYDEASPAERGLPPSAAVDGFARAVARTVSGCLRTLDAWRAAPLPDLIRPLGALSLALRGMGDVAWILKRYTCGEAHETFRLELMNSWKKPVPELPETLRTTATRLSILHHAWYRSEMGSLHGLVYADELEKVSHDVPYAWDIRFGVHLFQGEMLAAELCRERRDVLSLQARDTHTHLLVNVHLEARAYALCGDLIGLKRTLDPISDQASVHRGWKPVYHWALAEYHRLRGELDGARRELELGLGLVSAATHRVWAWTMSAYLETLLAQDDVQRALALAERVLRDLDVHDLSHVHTIPLSMSVALVMARAGEPERAARIAETAIEAFRSDGGGGVPLARLVESRAKIARWTADDESFERYRAELEALSRRMENTAVIARYEAFVRDASASDAARPAVCRAPIEPSAAAARAELLACANRAQRFHHALTLLARAAGSERALLFAFRNKQLSCAARHGIVDSTAELEGILRTYISAEIEDSTAATMTRGDATSLGGGIPDDWVDGDQVPYAFKLLTLPRDGQCFVGGIAVLARPGTGSGLSFQLMQAVCQALAELGDLELLAAAR